nr:pentatricopeptide repeat-containing protein At4g17616 [Quercus suber]XP_023872235.1 pentatricopeptide repeat-containing protein At4g17616 [Quercus suber]
MALALAREVLVQPRFSVSYSLGFRVAATVLRNIFINHNREFIGKNVGTYQISDVYYRWYQNPYLQKISTSTHPERICWEGSSHAVLLRKLETALKDHQLDEVWESFNDFKNLYGFPKCSIFGKLINELSYSSDPHWLQKACDLVLLVLKEDSGLLQSDTLIKLSLSLARSQMPIPASMILRVMLEKETLPPMNVLWLVVLHMVKTEIGTYIASNFLVQICDCFQHLNVKKNDWAKLIKPDTMIFNLVLDACVRFELSFKGQQIIELMSQTGVVADAHSITIIAQIHEMNGQRDELKKFKDHIDRVSAPFVFHYRQFYDSLLSLHFKFNDIDSAADLVLYIYRDWESFPIQNVRKELQKPHFVPLGSDNLKTGLKIQIVPEMLQKDSILKVEGKQELVTFRNGKLTLSNKALAKLINGYKRVGKISDISKLLLSIQKKSHSLEVSRLCSDVIDACIKLRWLETAHDILDDMESAGAPMGRTTYLSLLAAYDKKKMFREAKALLKQMRKAGLVLNLSDEMVVSICRSEAVDKNAMLVSSTVIRESDLAEFLVREMREENAVPPTVYEFNSSIYFFFKAKMLADALKTYRRMQEMKIQPTVQTFSYLVCGYSSLGMYRDITIIWGDIKRNMESGNLVVSRDLYEFLLLSFLRGGYFERVMEVIGYMKDHGMYTDKWMYKSEFLKLHMNLYRRLKASKARTDAQSKRLEYVQAFRKWVGID